MHNSVSVEINSIPTLLNEIIKQAVLFNASDIHFEPGEESLNIRYRVDGLLQEAVPIHKLKQSSLISRIKVLVNLDIAESRQPQDGRTNLQIGKTDFDVRVSTIPTIHGEKVVMRLLNRQHTALKIDELGMEKEDLAKYERMLKKRSGIILVTGPTGSGKTTTLYATLSYLNSKEINITTIEDPVEYQLPGINQIQINPKAGLTFARGLRSILRQDPDVIMVGEIRDLETAKIALQAALTGHLVFSTLHTNDAAASIVRLMDMGIEKYLIESSVIGAIAQRLVRKKIKDGYKGRIGIYEVMEGVQSQTNMRFLAQNGELKVEKGITTKEELARVLYLDN